MDAMVSLDGFGSNAPLVQRPLRRPPPELLRVSRGSYFVADCRTVGEIAQLVDLGSVVPEQREQDG